MRLFFSALLLFSFHIALSQQWPIMNAVFKECINVPEPGKCTNEKFESDISNLLSPEITANIKSSSDKNYFTITLAFISDEKGMVTSESLEIACENILLHQAIKDYINNLPPFNPRPKDKKNKDQRTAHILYYTFVYNESQDKYYSASNEELKEANIKPDYITLGTPPACQGCENSTKEELGRCNQQKITQLIIAEFKTPYDNGASRKIKMHGHFIIERDGSITIDEITCSEENEAFIREFKRALKKVPNFTPANYKGVPVRAKYAQPLTINLS